MPTGALFTIIVVVIQKFIYKHNQRTTYDHDDWQHLLVEYSTLNTPTLSFSNILLFLSWLYGCFIQWWYPQSPPQVLIIFSTKTHGFVGETHHFRKPPYIILSYLDVLNHTLDVKIFFERNRSGRWKKPKSRRIGSWLLILGCVLDSPKIKRICKSYCLMVQKSS